MTGVRPESRPGWPVVRRLRSAGSGPVTVAGCTVTVCRGCCCGTAKHPDVDHAGHLRTLRDAVADGGRLRIGGCFDLCERSNVVVVAPSPHGRRRGGRTTWFAQMLDDDLVADLAEWVQAGGPGVATLPARLAELVFSPPRRTRQAVR